jgi:hypothetical protein
MVIWTLLELDALETQIRKVSAGAIIVGDDETKQSLTLSHAFLWTVDAYVGFVPPKSV